MYSNKENVNILTAMLVGQGVKHVVVCPGSRNAPLVHNFDVCPDIICHPVTDERSAAFVALGIKQQTGEDVAVCVTSGSALLNVLPGVAEATYQHQGIIVVSADRPQMWIDQLDGQTLPQPDALGRFVGKAVSLPEPQNADERWYCERLLNEAFLALRSAAHPSVHINVPITEPLFDFSVETLPEVNVVERKKWCEAKDAVVSRLLKAENPLIVIGQTGRTDVPTCYLKEISKHVFVLSGQLSTDYHTFVDQLIYRIQQNEVEYKPDCVLYLGGHTVSKRLRQFLRTLDSACHVLVSDDGTLRDVSQHTQLVIEGRVRNVVSDIYLHLLTQENKGFPLPSSTVLNCILTDTEQRHKAYVPDYSQMLAVKLFEEKVKDDDVVYYANSMSVRLAMIYADHYVYCNRGLNGIEGCLSVAAGASLALQSALVYCVIGDLSFFYDENALWQQQLGSNMRILLLNNSQGGIFRNLKGLEKSPARDSLVSARHDATAEGICRQFHLKYYKATDEDSLREGLLGLCAQSDEPVLLEVVTDIDKDEKVFKQYYRSLL